MKKILFILGTRPEAIKLAPVIKILKSTQGYKVQVMITGQHKEMLIQILDIFNDKPDFDLNLMSKNQSLDNITSKILTGCLDIFLKKNKPDLIFVQGDTTTTFASSLSAFYHKIPIAHVEAGLEQATLFSISRRTNRKMTSTLATFHFTPTMSASKNLIDEGINKNKILVTGNTVIDSLLIASKKIDSNLNFYENHFKKYNIDFRLKKTILVTGHRRESFGGGFENICKALAKISIENDVQLIYPVHLNPNVQKPVYEVLGSLDNIFLIPPQDYLSFIFLMKNSYLILSDSGGVQEEAPSLGKPVLVMRENTERPEGVEFGTAKLVGTNYDKISTETKKLINNPVEYKKMSKAGSPYGDGNASENIIRYLDKNLQLYT